MNVSHCTYWDNMSYLLRQYELIIENEVRFEYLKNQFGMFTGFQILSPRFQ